MPTAAQAIAALKRAVKEIETRLDALERPKLEQRMDRLAQTVKEGFAEQKAMTDLLLKRSLEAERISDQRHDEIMAQFEKLQAKPIEN
jgi:signal transduction histidine kinase